MKVVVIGAGMGGLAAAARLARQGTEVTLVESADRVGGKMRQQQAGGAWLDAGPTVLTMRWVFDALFEALGSRVEDHLQWVPATTLARHFWPDGSCLDLHAQEALSADAVSVFAGAHEAERFRAFCRRSAATYEALEAPFIRAQRPASPLHLAARLRWGGLGKLAAITPFRTLAASLGDSFRDPRLRQLFGRYATYCGSSPFLAPATLMLVAHVEQQGVWMVEGGMVRLAESVASLARAAGVQVRLSCPAEKITHAGGRVDGVVLAGGERLPADAVVFNGDVAALGGGLLGPGIAPARKRPPDSLSAVTWTLQADLRDFPLARHTVFFGADSRREFEQIFSAHEIPDDPTVYVCAQDRGPDGVGPRGPERLLCLVNAPAGSEPAPARLARLEGAVQSQLARHGLEMALDGAGVVRTTPDAFARLYPGSRGALYGAASHGWQASFLRPGARTAITGLYCAGGSVHPGPGVPMAALSGQLAAAALLEEAAA